MNDLMEYKCAGRNCTPGMYQGVEGCPRCEAMTRRVSQQLKAAVMGASPQSPGDFKLPDLAGWEPPQAP